MKAELISTGTELLLGQTLNTNAQYLAQQLARLGINLYYQTTVGDHRERMAEVLRQALSRSDLIITTGGLGPTLDDLTKELAADLFGLEMVLDEEELAKIQGFFRERGQEMPENNRKQAYLPKGSVKIPNRLGTAPGAIMEKDGKTVIVLPGPPFEMRPMFEETVFPYLVEKTQADPAVLLSRVLKVVVIGESSIEERLMDLLKSQANPTLALLAKDAEVHVRMTARRRDQREAQGLIAAMEKEVRARLGDFVYGADEETLEEIVGRELKERGLTAAFAESCTGGLLSHRMTNIPGSSDYFLAGLVTYANEAKMKFLGVSEEVLRRHGAVSPQCAEAMVKGVCQATGADVGVAVTGIAGPGGGTPDKPVGLAYLGIAIQGDVWVETLQSFGDRQVIKEQTANKALNGLRLRLRQWRPASSRP